MDPVTAIGLASGVLTFVSFSAKLVKGWKEINDSGSLEGNATLEDVVSQMRTLHSRLIPPDLEDKRLVGDAKDLCDIAKDCESVSKELLKLLERMKPSESTGGIRAKWESLGAMWNTLIQGKTRQELDEKLSRCYQRLTTVLAFLMSTKLEGLDDLAQDNNYKLAQLQKNIRELKVQLQQGSLDEAIRGQITRLVEAQEETIKRTGHARVLHSLKYDIMQERSDDIRQRLNEINQEQKERGGTFQWIFERDDEGARVSDNDNETKMKKETRGRFTKWLSSGEGIFHISGKLGSGKSTLMQLLCDHPRTQDMLQEWAGTRRLVRASLFFSALKGGIQQALNGLYRTLLYEILMQWPDMTSEVLGKSWNKALSLPWQIDTTIAIPNTDISAAVDQLILLCSPTGTCFCFFVDGLDEFHDEDDGPDKRDLVKLLRKWTTASDGNLKLCVASREEPEFKFLPEATLRLHNLTRYDMERFVQARLHGIVDEDVEKILVGSIPEKAQGIFLWVKLVIRKIREELEISAGVAEDILDQFPPGLRQLLDRTVNSILEQHSLKAHLSFEMMLLVQKSSRLARLPILAYSFLDDYCKNAQFAEQKTGTWLAINSDATSKRIQRARTRLCCWCKGLLEPVTGRDSSQEYVTFTHRSIREYFEEEIPRQRRSLALQGHSAGDAVSQLLLAQIRLEKPGNDGDSHSYLNIETIIHVRAMEKLDSEPFNFLDVLKSVTEEPIHEISPGDQIYGAAPRWVLRKLIYNRVYSYPKWKLEYDSTSTSSVFRVFELASCFFSSSHFMSFGDPDRRILNLLLKKSQSHLQTRVRFILSSFLHDGLKSSDHIDLSIWHHYLLAEVLLRLSPESIFSQVDAYPYLDSNFALISESFLKAGADPDFSVTVTQSEKADKEASKEEKGEMRFEFGRERTPVIIRYGFMRGKRSRWPEGWRQECKNWSLQDFFKRLDVPNKDILLQLLDENTRALAGAEPDPNSRNELKDSEHDFQSSDGSRANGVQLRWLPPIAIRTEHLFPFFLGLLSAILISVFASLLE